MEHVSPNAFSEQLLINILELSRMQKDSSNARCLWGIQLANLSANSTKISMASFEQLQSPNIHCVLTGVLSVNTFCVQLDFTYECINKLGT